MEYSILMSVYEKENPVFFQQAIESMLNQTIKSNDFVIVCDGPLTKELYDVLDYYELNPDNHIHRIQLQENQGLGIALQKGLLECKNELVARMDSDDISIKNRIQIQLPFFEENKELCVCGGHIVEFNNTINDLQVKKKVPLNNKDIINYARRRNPFNHMTVILRKSMILSLGNYQSFLMFEDYLLWMKILKKGFEVMNVDETLVYMRVGNGMYQRRGGVGYCIKEYKFLIEIYKMRMISFPVFIENLICRISLRILPQNIRKKVYEQVIRKE